mmetsp:Transcript_33449/g.84577  ORF Transcript_33449/g.84577 Transcript_33449/m.84577 type:complete len:205 (-) Transcript_33449:1933-2547(-)
MRTRSPFFKPARSPRDSSTVTKITGMAQASSNVQEAGFVASKAAGPLLYVLKHPGDSPNTSSATCNVSTWSPNSSTVPEQSAPGGPGSPGYKPMTFSTSRKLRPTALILVCTKPGIGVCLLPCWTSLRFDSAPRAAMFSRLGPLKVNGLLTRRVQCGTAARRATSSSLSVLRLGKLATNSAPSFLVFKGSRSRQLMERVPGYSM